MNCPAPKILQNNIAKPSLKIAICAGEASGDQLGYDLITALKEKTEQKIELIGVGGPALASLGLKSLFPYHELSLMGLGAVLKNIFRLLAYLYKLKNFILAQKPDCLLLIDSQSFNLSLAKKIRAKNPDIPIILYVAPTVWAWQPERAQKINAFIDHIFTILPFENKVLKELNGPPATYVGHRLLSHPKIREIAQNKQNHPPQTQAPCLLLLPGSRLWEIEKLMPAFAQASALFAQYYPQAKIILPSFPAYKALLEKYLNKYQLNYEISFGEDNKWRAFSQADVALAACGTVSLELALAKIPMVLAYKVDFFSKLILQPKITIWSAALPNIISDLPLISEYFNEYVHPARLARELRYLLLNSDKRNSQLEGFKQIYNLMKPDKAAGDIAAAKLLELINNK